MGLFLLRRQIWKVHCSYVWRLSDIPCWPSKPPKLVSWSGPSLWSLAGTTTCNKSFQLLVGSPPPLSSRESVLLSSSVTAPRFYGDSLSRSCLLMDSSVATALIMAGWHISLCQPRLSPYNWSYQWLDLHSCSFNSWHLPSVSCSRVCHQQGALVTISWANISSLFSHILPHKCSSFTSQ